jgi:hypothetical protein
MGAMAAGGAKVDFRLNTNFLMKRGKNRHQVYTARIMSRPLSEEFDPIVV